jgi:amidophosphoribosyltransferase
MQEINDECGVFGIFNHADASEITYYGIHALQHRGQESAGICSSDGEVLKLHCGMGLVVEAISKNYIKELKGNHAIGHVRYTTAGSSSISNAQPLKFRYKGGQVAIAHNGNLVNADILKEKLESQGSIFQTDSDTEVISHLMAKRNKLPVEQSLRSALREVGGAYALVVLTNDKLIAVQDPRGFRPLSIGKLGDSWVVASETCAFDAVGAEFVRDVKSGEMIIIDKFGLKSVLYTSPLPKRICSFEYIYFARPDSDINGINVHLARKKLGRQLWYESKTDADIVIGVPDSGISSAIGYAEASGIPYEVGMIKNRYVGRTFIQPSEMLRTQSVKMKLGVVKKVVKNKKVILVDDSLVRGHTSKRIVKLLKDAGAKEVHLKVSSPPIRYSCVYGIDTPNRAELIAANFFIDEICKEIEADSLYYISEDAMIKSIGKKDSTTPCLACFNGKYPDTTNIPLLTGFKDI